MYYIRLYFFQFFVYGLNVIDQILCLFCWNYKNFSKLTNTSPKWRHLWNFICLRSMPLRFVLHPFVFFECYRVLCVWLECYRSMPQILCLAVGLTQILRFSLNWRTHLQNGVILWYLYYHQVNATTVCITSVCVFFSFLCMAWMLSIKYFVIFTQISRFSLNWRAHLQNGVIFIIYFTPDQCP